MEILAAILSLVDSLDSSHRSLVHTLNCTFTPRKAILHCVVLGLYEEWRQRVFEKGLLFEQVFNRKLVLEWEHKVRPGAVLAQGQLEAFESGPSPASRSVAVPVQRNSPLDRKPH